MRKASGWVTGMGALVALGLGCSDSHAPDGDDDDDDDLGAVDAGGDPDDAAADAALDADVPDPVTCEELPVGLQPDPSAHETEGDCWAFTRFEEGDAREQGYATWPSIAIGHDGSIHATYFKYRSSHGRAELRHVTNEAGTWQGENVDCAVTMSFNEGGGLAVDGTGALQVLAIQLGEGAPPLFLRTRTDGVWSAQALDGFWGGPSLDLTTDAAGRIHLLVGGPDPYVMSGDLFHLQRADEEAVWFPQPIPGSPYAGRYGELAIGANGAAYILTENACPGGPDALEACRADLLPEQRDVELSTNELGGPWTTEAIAADLFGNSKLALVAAADGSLHVAYVDLNGGVVYGVRRGGVWSWDRITDAKFWTIATIAMAVDQSFAVHLVMSDITDTDAVYLTNRNGEWQSELIDAAALQIGGLVIDQDGVPHVTYTSETPDGRDYTMVIASRTCP